MAFGFYPLPPATANTDPNVGHSARASDDRSPGPSTYNAYADGRPTPLQRAIEIGKLAYGNKTQNLAAEHAAVADAQAGQSVEGAGLAKGIGVDASGNAYVSNIGGVGVSHNLAGQKTLTQQ
jgi:hypothetical protein